MQSIREDKPGVGPTPEKKPKIPGKKEDPSKTPRPVPIKDPEKHNKKPSKIVLLQC